jgi:hypothetical protein
MKVYVHWMNLMKTKIIIKFQSLEILRERVMMKSIQFLTILQKNMFNRFKISSFKCKSHVQEIISQKNMFGCPLKFILGFFVFLVINQNNHTQLCMNLKTHHHHELF